MAQKMIDIMDYMKQVSDSSQMVIVNILRGIVCNYDAVMVKGVVRAISGIFKNYT
jgi:hypothetical protein